MTFAFLPFLYTYEPWEEQFCGHHLFKSDMLLLFFMVRLLTEILDNFAFDEKGCVVTMVTASSAGRPHSNVIINVKKMYSLTSGPI